MTADTPGLFQRLRERRDKGTRESLALRDGDYFESVITPDAKVMIGQNPLSGQQHVRWTREIASQLAAEHNAMGPILDALGCLDNSTLQRAARLLDRYSQEMSLESDRLIADRLRGFAQVLDSLDASQADVTGKVEP